MPPDPWPMLRLLLPRSPSREWVLQDSPEAFPSRARRSISSPPCEGDLIPW